MFRREPFEAGKRVKAKAQAEDQELRRLALDVLTRSDRFDYGYQWTWLGLPIIQLPQDIVATQEIIWACRPDIIIETGIAWGGSVVLYASILQLIGKGKVIAVDVNLMDHVRRQILDYPFSSRIHLYKGSSTDPSIVSRIKEQIGPGQSVMVLLDSDHSHAHVLEELRLYAPLVTIGQYLIVSDTIVDDIPKQSHRPRRWGPGNNPKTALKIFLAECSGFEVDRTIGDKLLITCAPDGYCRRVAR
ncbi:MAG: cephalosporin hydroxylase family protein [Proteobacteria bacterium]|nr:cephalosporin hydroxylase family protein [Pseudomonadota bacterium]